jgi:DMSO/TMAO reductase YedYZ heme-binding membrane subunit
MSNSSTTVPHERSSKLSNVARSAVSRRGIRIITAPLRFVGFWAAITLPFLYLPLLYSGLQGEEVVVFLGLLGLNAFALVAGHDYGQ